MNYTKIILAICILFFIGLNSCKKEQDKIAISDVDCSTVNFSQTIMPLISARCGNASCHGSGSSNGAMTNYAEVKVYADNGKINSRVLTEQDMPKGSSLSSDELGRIKCWLDSGAPDN